MKKQLTKFGSIIYLIAFIFFFYPCFADTFVMKNGMVYKGKVIKETLDTITVLNENRKRDILEISQIKTQTTDLGVIKIDNKIPEDSTRYNPNELNQDQTSNIKLAMISKEIEENEKKMNGASVAIIGGPLLTSLSSLALVFVLNPQNDNDRFYVGMLIGGIGVLGAIISGVGILQYWDGANTVAQLRAKKYDLMLYPFVKYENFVNNKTGVFGVALHLGI